MNSLFSSVDRQCWCNWHWQLSNACKSLKDFQKLFPSLPQHRIDLLGTHIDNYRFLITPYTLSCIELDDEGNPLIQDPIWRQLHCEQIDYTPASSEGNWEVSGEVKFGILHQKYPGRALIRITDTCFSYCTYCYCAHRTIGNKGGNQQNYKLIWPQVLEYLRGHDDIYEVLLSGGDPLLLSNNELAGVLDDLRSIPSISLIRINTRVFTYCPFRIDSELIKILKAFNVNALEVHFSSHKELTPQVDEALSQFSIHGYRPLLLSRAPLLKGVNDSIDKLQTLFVELYKRGVSPYYLFHYAPYIMGRQELGTSVRDGVALLGYLRRRLPGPAIPRYTLFHSSGKHDIPLDENGTDEFKYRNDNDGKPIIEFCNWRGERVTYPDVCSG